MGNNKSKSCDPLGNPRMPSIKYVENPGQCYLTDPPQYSPTYVIFEDDTSKSYPDQEIIDELARQNKMHLWKDRYMDEYKRNLKNFMNDPLIKQKLCN